MPPKKKVTKKKGGGKKKKSTKLSKKKKVAKAAKLAAEKEKTALELAAAQAAAEAANNRVTPRFEWEQQDLDEDAPGLEDLGDFSLETADALAVRYELRNSPKIVQWIKVYYRTFKTRSLQGISRSEYMEVMLLMIKALHK